MASFEIDFSKPILAQPREEDTDNIIEWITFINAPILSVVRNAVFNKLLQSVDCTLDGQHFRWVIKNRKLVVDSDTCRLDGKEFLVAEMVSCDNLPAHVLIDTRKMISIEYVPERLAICLVEQPSDMELSLSDQMLVKSRNRWFMMWCLTTLFYSIFIVGLVIAFCVTHPVASHARSDFHQAFPLPKNDTMPM